MWHHSRVVIGQKPLSQEGSMGWRIVVVEQPCCSATDQVASFAHSPVDVSNFNVECSINCLTRRNKFFVNNSLLIKETNQH